MVQAQFNYTDNGDGTATITRYYDSGGDVSIPGMIDGLLVISIGYEAFGYSSLTSVSIPDSVTSIGDWAFVACTSLTSVTIGTNVSNIGGGAFDYCTSLASLTIPSSVTSIGDHAFSDCASLSAITVDALNSLYSSLDGVLFNSSQTTLIQCPGGKTGSYTIPDSVTSIGYEAFGYSSLTSVTIPDNVTNIGDRAFVASSLTSVTIGTNVASIVQEAFEYCSGLSSVTIPNSVTSIERYAFTGSGLTNVTIPNSVTRIGEEAFEGCINLASVTIPNSVTNIEDYPFIACSSLTALTVDALNLFYSSLDGVLFDKSKTILIEYSGGKAGNYTVPDSVINIGDYAFSYCPLQNVAIPNSVTSIGDGAFLTCTSLTSVIIPYSVTSIGGQSFEGCSSLTNITIPNTVTSIGDQVLSFCTSLTSVTIPNSVTNIGWGALEDCTSLTNAMIGSSVTNIGGYAFGGCSSLTVVLFEGDAPSADSSVFSGDNKATVYYLPGTTGWGTTFAGLPAVLWNLPVADAGATAAWLVSANGANATAVLNGSRSYDPNGDALQHLWFSSPSAQPPTLLATGVVAVIVLPVGSHPINLVVSDALAASTNSIVVSVLTIGQAVQQLIRLVNESEIRHPRPLLEILSAAAASVHRHHPQVAVIEVRVFQHLVRDDLSRRDPALAAMLIQAAQQVIEALEVGNGHPDGQPHCQVTRMDRRGDGHVALRLSGVPGQIHIVEASTNLVDWERIGAAMDDGDGSFTLEDANAARFPNRFYRVVSP